MATLLDTIFDGRCCDRPKRGQDSDKGRLNNDFALRVVALPDTIDNIKIKVRSGEAELEIEASLSNFRQAIELAGDVAGKLPKPSAEAKTAALRLRPEGLSSHLHEPPSAQPQQAPVMDAAPAVTVEKGDSLSDVISKFFTDPWGRNPRKLMEVREALQSYGLNYPKQSVAVALLRLAKGSKIRRFKGESGEYVYTASTGAARVTGPLVAPAPQPAHEAAPPAADAVEEQLDLDAPTAN